ncbi:MAG: type 4a pilus biogenesis protein PilO [Candidatus Amesbacteria bacterium]|nr:type 4a pilus biogenesis protein PilO [Candidatus Amesbacteria bacterium]
MAIDYRNSLTHYRKYLQIIQKRPMWRATLFVTLSLLLLIVLLVFALRPTLVTIAGLTGDIQSKRDIESQLNTKIANLQSMVQSYQKIQPQLYLIDSALPLQSKFGSLSDYLVKSASQTGVMVDSIVLGNINLSSQSPPNQGLTDFEFSINIKGSYTQVHDMLYKIENSRRLMSISSVQITRSNSGQLAASIKGKTYFILENYSP